VIADRAAYDAFNSDHNVVDIISSLCKKQYCSAYLKQTLCKGDIVVS